MWTALKSWCASSAFCYEFCVEEEEEEQQGEQEEEEEEKEEGEEEEEEEGEEEMVLQLVWRGWREYSRNASVG